MNPLKSIIITPEKDFPNEAQWLNELLNEGVWKLHIRKPHFSEEMMIKYIENIDSKYRKQLVIHSHHTIAKSLEINRIHYPENERIKQNFRQDFQNFGHSTSVHSISDFNRLEKKWEYAFLSPIFPSLSKPNYGKNSFIFEEIQHRTNFHTQLIALGGIKSENIYKIKDKNIEGIALLGSIWQGKNPLKNYQLCKKTGLLY